MGIGVAVADAFRTVIVQPGHYHINADSADSAVELCQGQGIKLEVDPEHNRITIQNSNILPCFTIADLKDIQDPVLGQIVAVKDQDGIGALAVFDGRLWRGVALGSAL
jgi:hypothetical protein